MAGQVPRAQFPVGTHSRGRRDRAGGRAGARARNRRRAAGGEKLRLADPGPWLHPPAAGARRAGGARSCGKRRRRAVDLRRDRQPSGNPVAARPGGAVAGGAGGAGRAGRSCALSNVASHAGPAAQPGQQRLCPCSRCAGCAGCHHPRYRAGRIGGRRAARGRGRRRHGARRIGRTHGARHHRWGTAHDARGRRAAGRGGDSRLCGRPA